MIHGCRSFLGILALCAGFQLSGNANAAQCCLAVPGTTPIRAEIIADGLDQPWGMAFPGDGSVLVTERSGALRRVVEGEVSSPFDGLPRIGVTGQGGLLDIALDPAFETNRLIYLSFAEPSSDWSTYSTAVARAEIDLDGERLLDTTVIFSANKRVLAVGTSDRVCGLRRMGLCS